MRRLGDWREPVSSEVEPMPWTEYVASRPTEPGLYLWRLPSAVCVGLFVIVAAKMRARGAGYATVLSPDFDHWDGYQVHVPPCLSWRATDGQADGHVEPDGFTLGACPFCGNVPRWSAFERTSDGGLMCSARPQSLNEWRVQCCQWIAGPRAADPRHIAAAWNRVAALSQPEAGDA